MCISTSTLAGSVMHFNPFTLPLKLSWICIYPIKPLNSSSFSGSVRREVTYSSALSHCNTSALLLKHVSIKLWEPIKAIIQTQTHIVKWLYTHQWGHMHIIYTAYNPGKWNHTPATDIIDTHGECSSHTFEFILNICVVYASESCFTFSAGRLFHPYLRNSFMKFPSHLA